MGKLVISGLDNIAGEMGCSKKTLYKWIRERNFPAFKMDRVWRVLPRDAELWLAIQRGSCVAARQSAPLAEQRRYAGWAGL